jgi:hypothetical protein
MARYIYLSGAMADVGECHEVNGTQKKKRSGGSEVQCMKRSVGSEVSEVLKF